jgi:uncharacterized membrane protein
LALAIFSLLPLIALATPDRVGPAPDRTLQQWASLTGLLLLPLLLALNSVLDALARRRLRGMFADLV